MYDKYIGIPYKEYGRDTDGIDCWGLARLFYKQEFNIDLPSYNTETVRIFDPKLSQSVNEFIGNWTKTAAPKLGDLCLFNILGEPTHVGIYLENSQFLHAPEGYTSVIESFKKPTWNKRLEGIYTYTPVSTAIQLTGSPHPFKTSKIVEFTQPGTTIKQCVEFISEKYKLSERLFKQINVAIDGIPVSKNDWSTTILRAGQLVTYNIIPQGGGGRSIFRMLLTVALTVFVAVVLPTLLPGVGTLKLALASAAVTIAGTLLIDALVPIRPPPGPENVESGAQLNLFTGTSNRGNPYGAIPVVLGRVRMTPYLGSQAYIDTQTSTSYMHMQLVWGFGPLLVNDLYIGANKIDNYYQETTGSVVPLPVTVSGFTDTNGQETETAGIQLFNTMYPNIVEQQFRNVELVNQVINGTTVNNEEVITFAETAATKVNAVIGFPEGCRKLDKETGGSSNVPVYFTATLERIVNGVAEPKTSFSTSNTFTDVIISPSQDYQDYDYSNHSPDYISFTAYFYQKIAFCITPNNGIVTISGTPSDRRDNPTLTQQGKLTSTTLAILLSSVTTNFSYEPIIPVGYKVLYKIEVYANQLLSTENVIQNTHSYSGWVFTTTQLTTAQSYYDSNYGGYFEENVPGNRWNVSITAGTLGAAISGSEGYIPTDPNGVLPSKFNIWSTRNLTNVTTKTNSAWGTTFGPYMSFMNSYAVWNSTNASVFDQTVTVQTPYAGIYMIEASLAGYNGFVEIGSGTTKLSLNYSAFDTNAPLRQPFRLGAPGSTSIRVYANNSNPPSSGTAESGIAVRITYLVDNSVNFVPGSNYFIVGDNEFYNYKDGFNYVLSWNNLTPGQYRLRIKRTSTSDPDIPGGGRGYQASFKTSLISASAFKTGTTIVPPKGVGICRTAVVLESSGKTNGSVDGVNGLVQSLTWDYVLNQQTNTKEWIKGFTSNNPASLFLHVLTHPANAYKVDFNSIDIPTISDWHTYCATAGTINDNGTTRISRPPLTYNGVITNTTSVLSVLQDICAAGMASPVFIDGKWSVVIDRPRPYVIQHFTPHNSWGFEAVKSLAKLPDAFRINFPDETNAYQPTEVLVANFDKTTNNANVIEEINLPGITKIEQVRYFARWHFAQLQYRPETFTINTDFEYLICTRGDRVKVTHDVPQWGLATGRIKSINAGKNILTLTENVTLLSGVNYQIRIRTDNITASGGGSIERSFTVNSDGLYNTITLSSAVNSTVKVDDLFMLGELNKVTQDLLVQSVEPTTNTSAKITLVAYNESLYNFDFRPFEDNSPYLPSYTPTFAKRIGSQFVQTTIVGYPTVSNVLSGDQLTEEIASGNYQNVVLISWTNSADLPLTAQKVEFQIVKGGESFTDTAQSGINLANKDAGSYTVYGLSSNTVYKVRARYRNAEGTISGPWSSEYFHTVQGKYINYYNAATLVLDLQNTAIIAKPTPGQVIPSNFSHYEFRLVKDVNNNITTDFWDIGTTFKFTGVEQGSYDLRQLSLPRISSAGITYRVACRAVDKTNNYSSSSVIASIVVQTIK